MTYAGRRSTAIALMAAQDAPTSDEHSTWRYETETLLMEISYLGEAGQLVKRFSQDQPSVRDWDY
jgi:hypothetical protein